ncbi:hypothetical protein [Marinococcus luteus]|uniref:hypothetical protein n=1 Tax=Marinococcus luteus TaxID=1122204 RepID=UPI002ACC8CE6|nr:hypothetical protein [Marinococcus luteus]MDZ5782042.1 hypothetical protein [Marinococcus luteus]
MRTQDLKQAVIACLAANEDEMEMSALVRQVTRMLPFPVHARELADCVTGLEQAGAVKKLRTSSGSVAVVLRKEASSGAGYFIESIHTSRL